MCILIFKPANETITDEVLETCFINNDDGAGFAYINTDNNGVKRIIIKKTMEFTTFLRQYKRAQRTSPESPFLIHFRIRTHGVTSTFNCHPFKVNDKLVFGHNGIIPRMRHHAEKSDTQIFNEDYLQDLPEGFEKNRAITKMIEDFIGMSKLVLLDIEGNHVIYNKSKGIYVGGVWYSNASYMPRVVRTFDKPKVTQLPTKRVLTEKSYMPCEKCKVWKSPINKMSFYFYNDKCYGYCSECAKSTEAMPFKQVDDRKVDYKVFLEWSGVEGAIGVNPPMIFFHTWKNPWGPFNTTNDSPTNREVEEYYRELEDGLASRWMDMQ